MANIKAVFKKRTKGLKETIDLSVSSLRFRKFLRELFASN